MTFQYIINHLNKPHLWYIVLTAGQLLFLGI